MSKIIAWIEKPMIFISDKEFQLAKTELLVPYPYNSEGSYIYLLPKIIFLFTSPYHLGGYQIAASSSENFRRNSNLIYFSQIYFRLGSSSFLPVEFPFLDFVGFKFALILFY